MARLNTIRGKYDLRKGIKDNYPTDPIEYQKAGYELQYGLWWYGEGDNRRIVIPDDAELKSVLMHEFHDIPYAGPSALGRER